uniref:CX domain-containing protein n=1 Tax=Macrostomum lignano TaxID=282301 RepID=A0A1I8GV03_9PLAT
GITSNKKALLLAGSVYIATRVRPRIFNSQGNLFNKVTEDFAICAGLVRTRSNSTYGWYAYDHPELNDSSTSSALTPTEMSTTPGSSTAQRLTESGNSTGSSTTSPIVTYQYFLCPSDLFNYAYDGEDIYCCGPAGHQMCCSKEDFKEQLGKFSSVGLGMGLLFGVLFVASGCGITIYLCRDRVRSVFRKMGGSGSAGTARQDVTFRPVAKTETEKDAHVTLSDLRGRRRSNSRSQNNNLYPHSAPNPVPGLTSNKKALLLAGSVYIATRVRPRIFNSQGSLYNKVTEDFAICAGLVRTRSNSTYGWYAYDQPELNDSSTSSALATTEMSTISGASTAQQLLTESGNSTDGTTTSPIVTYQYFLCPSDLFNYAYDAEDIYCCGPAGHQMCCSKEDFKEQLGAGGFFGLGMRLLFGVLFVAFGCGFIFYLCRDTLRSVLRRSRGGRSSAGAARQDVTFRPVAKTEEDAHVTLSGLRERRRSNSGSQHDHPYPNPAPAVPAAYPLYPTELGGGNQPQYPLYPPQVDGSSNSGVSGGENQPQYPLYPPPAQQMPPIPQHPPPAYEDLQH